MRALTRTLSLLASAAVLAFASAAAAQEQPAPSPAAGPMAHHDGERGEWRKAHEVHRAKFLHDVLNIRADQEPAFQAFLADMHPHHDGMGEHPAMDERKDMAADHAAMESMTTPERLDRIAAFMAKRTAERQASFQRRADAIKRFYAVLNADQRRTFDALSARGMGHGLHGMGREDGSGWGGHHGGGERGEG